jgi:hypothetical protein
MAFTKLIMQNPFSADIKHAPVGFSWTSLFFGPLVPLFRGHYAGCAFWAVMSLFTAGLAIGVQAFIYNKRYLMHLVNNGYKVQHSPLPLDYVASKVSMKLPEIEKV